MIPQKDLDQEVSQLIKSAHAKGNAVVAKWLVHEVLGSHTAIEGDDSEWYQLCAYGHVRATVRKIVQQFKNSATDEIDPNLVLPGFERLQVAYLVERRGVQQLVPTPKLSDDEIDAKIAEIEQMAAGCLLHAQELRRYKNSKQQQTA